jgi:hypothetical protein
LLRRFNPWRINPYQEKGGLKYSGATTLLANTAGWLRRTFNFKLIISNQNTRAGLMVL